LGVAHGPVHEALVPPAGAERHRAGLVEPGEDLPAVGLRQGFDVSHGYHGSPTPGHSSAPLRISRPRRPRELRPSRFELLPNRCYHARENRYRDRPARARPAALRLSKETAIP